jgi:hypothetical protein
MNDHVYINPLSMRRDSLKENYNIDRMFHDKDLDPGAVTGIRHAAVEKTTLTNIVFFVF